MLDFLKKTLGITGRGVKNGRQAARRSVRLGVERLETREVLSGFGAISMLPVNLQASNPGPQNTSPSTNVANLSQLSNGLNQSVANAISNEIRVIDGWITEIYTLLYDLTHQVPNLEGVNFTMTSQRNGGSNYTLQILQQTDHPLGTASFTGLWGGHASVAGTLSVVPDGSISIQATWTEGNNVHTLQGTITGQPGSYHIEADVTVNGSSDTGPGHLSGNQS